MRHIPHHELNALRSGGVSTVPSRSNASRLRRWQHHGASGQAVKLPETALPDSELLEAELQALALFRADAAEIELRGQELEETHSRLDAALNTMPHGLLMLDAEERVVLCNRRLRAMFNFDPEIVRPGATLAQVLAHSCAQGNLPDLTPAQALAAIRARMAHGVANSFERALPDGRLFSVHLEPTAEGGWVFTYEDITARVAAIRRATHLARHDATTGLPNRTALIEAMSEAWQRQRGCGFNLLCLEIERFQELCDTCGHALGDELLHRTAERLSSGLRAGDTVAYLRGGGFAVLQLAPADTELATSLAQRLLDICQAPLRLRGRTLLPTCRIGIATRQIGVREAVEEAEVLEVLRNASLALTCTSEAEGGRIVLYSPELDRRAQDRHALETDLRAALGLGQFSLHYQSQVSVAERRVVGFEALLRWQHPQRGFVSPGVFVPLAEQLGLMDEIGAWVLHTACGQAVEWPGDVKLAVNLSPAQFKPHHGPALESVVADALARSGLSPTRLELEITESLRLMDDQPTRQTLHALRGLGAAIALDDFGTGYSSLSYLRSVPFDTLKIDQSFVRSLPEAESIAIVRAISALGASLHIATVAEGVETADQLAALLAEGCDIMQGYLFSRPVPAGEVAGVLVSAFTPICR